MQGCGVKTPAAADVAAMTCGLIGLLQMPNGLMFANGAKSMIVAAPAFVPPAGLGDAASADGAAPKLQVRTAPSTTRTAMDLASKQRRLRAGRCNGIPGLTRTRVVSNARSGGCQSSMTLRHSPVQPINPTRSTRAG